MANVQVDRLEIKALLRSRDVLRDLERRARKIANAAGPGYEADSEIGPRRARASVRSATPEAHYDEATNRTLTRAIDAGRN